MKINVLAYLLLEEMLSLTLDKKVSEGNVYNIFYKMPIKYIDERTEVAQQGFNFFNDNLNNGKKTQPKLLNFMDQSIGIVIKFIKIVRYIFIVITYLKNLKNTKKL